MAIEMMVLFAFGMVITGIVALGVVEARDVRRRQARAESVASPARSRQPHEAPALRPAK